MKKRSKKPVAKKNSNAPPAKALAGGNHRKRLRDKFNAAGIAALHDYEVAELLLTYAIARKDVKPFAKELIKKCGGLVGVFEADAKTLTSVNGVGPGAALLLGLVRGVAMAYLKEKPGLAVKVKNARDAVSFIKGAFKTPESESLLALYFNAQQHRQYPDVR
jgi:DNA repair protein RadC